MLRLQGCSRQRRIILRRPGDPAIPDPRNSAQTLLGVTEVGPDKDLWNTPLW
jgi:hypothetical protein